MIGTCASHGALLVFGLLSRATGVSLACLLVLDPGPEQMGAVMVAKKAGWQVLTGHLLTGHLPWTALAPVLLDHGPQTAAGELLRLQHTALLHAHWFWL